jgi:hypothetical protein
MWRMFMRLAAVCMVAWLAVGSHLQQKNDTVITLERTACYGWCPMYSLHVNSSGEVQYEGKQFVSVIGVRTTTITEQQVRELLDGFARIDFFSLRDVYETGPDIVSADGSVTHSLPTTDLPNTYIGLTLDGRTKKIRDYEYAPKKLSELEREIERVADPHQWLHDMDSRLTLNSLELSKRMYFIDDLKNQLIISADAWSEIKPGMTRLMRASGQGKAAVAQKELESGADANAQDASGWTALMLAAVEGKEDVVALLLRSGALIDLRDNHGDTALIGAAANPYLFNQPESQVAVVKNLIASGAAAAAQNQLGESALMWAAKSGSLEVVSSLLEAGADNEQMDKNGKTALFYARRALASMGDDVRKERFEAVVALLGRPGRRSTSPK